MGRGPGPTGARGGRATPDPGRPVSSENRGQGRLTHSEGCSQQRIWTRVCTTPARSGTHWSMLSDVGSLPWDTKVRCPSEQWAV